jgi:L-asparaginase II
MKDAVLAEYVRDGFVESVHRGYLLALNSDGSTALELGDSICFDLSAFLT